MKPASFDYVSVQSTREAVERLAEHREHARILAGGQSLVPLMNLRLASPRVLIDINGVKELSGLGLSDGPAPRLRIGATTRHSAIASSSLLSDRCAILAAAAAEVGHLQIRNRGTIGGSVAHADPHAEYPVVLAALDAQVVCLSSRGCRTVSVRDFVTGPFTTDCQDDEIVVEVNLPAGGEHDGWGFFELAARPGDFPLFAIAVLLRGGPGAAVAQADVWMSGSGPRPRRLAAVEEALRIGASSPTELSRVAAGAAAELDLDDAEEMPRELQRALLRAGLRTAIEAALIRRDPRADRSP